MCTYQVLQPLVTKVMHMYLSALVNHEMSGFLLEYYILDFSRQMFRHNLLYIPCYDMYRNPRVSRLWTNYSFEWQKSNLKLASQLFYCVRLLNLDCITLAKFADLMKYWAYKSPVLPLDRVLSTSSYVLTALH
jgi:hypothetical protein